MELQKSIFTKGGCLLRLVFCMNLFWEIEAFHLGAHVG